MRVLATSDTACIAECDWGDNAQQVCIYYREALKGMN